MSRVVVAMAGLCLASLLSLAPAGPAIAQATAGDGALREAQAAIPESARRLLVTPQLAGSGTLRWFGLRIYDARLWVGPQGIDPSELAGRPFALELSYARSLSGEAIATRSADEMARMGFGDPERRAAWLEAMRAIFPDVRDGDRIVGVNQPGATTRFYLNDRQLGVIDDPAFAQAFFAIWLDPRTVAPALRDALLSRQ